MLGVLVITFLHYSWLRSFLHLSSCAIILAFTKITYSIDEWSLAIEYEL